MSDAATHPSPFYALIEHGAQYELCFLRRGRLRPTSSCRRIDRCGALHGTVDRTGQGNKIGNGCYRLTERCAGPLSGLGIDWGDEFLRRRSQAGSSSSKKLVLPRRFVHWHIIGSAGFTNSHPFADLLHRFGGGWGASPAG